MFLRTEEMLQIKETVGHLHLDQQVKLNHEKCPAGTDTKERLYVKRNSAGIVFYCHHCGSKGFLRTVERWVDERTTTPPVKVERGLPPNYSIATDDTTLWCSEARLWWHSYELTQEHARMFGVKSYAKQLYLTAGANGVQQRNFNGTGPKYITYKTGDGVVLYMGSMKEESCPALMIVEDLVSAYKLSIAEFDVMCLMGTSMTDREKVAAASWNNVYVWLDDDSAGISSSAKIVKELSPFTEVKGITTMQPKEISFEDLTLMRKSL